VNKYEVVFILDPKKVDETGDAFIAQATALIQEKLQGKVNETTAMGRKHFARPIGKHRAGVYWDLLVEMSADQVAVLQDSYRLDSAVLRLQVFSYTPPPPPLPGTVPGSLLMD
jgi:small subunit ribosomal protein S6